MQEISVEVRNGEQEIPHKFVLTIKLKLLLSYRMRHYNQKHVPGIFVTVLFFLLPVMISVFAFQVCGFLVLRSFLGS